MTCQTCGDSITDDIRELWNSYREVVNHIESANQAKIELRNHYSKGDEFNAADEKIWEAICGLDSVIGFLIDEAAEHKAWHTNAMKEKQKQMESDAATIEKINEAKANKEAE